MSGAKDPGGGGGRRREDYVVLSRAHAQPEAIDCTLPRLITTEAFFLSLAVLWEGVRIASALRARATVFFSLPPVKYISTQKKRWRLFRVYKYIHCCCVFICDVRSNSDYSICRLQIYHVLLLYNTTLSLHNLYLYIDSEYIYGLKAILSKYIYTVISSFTRSRPGISNARTRHMARVFCYIYNCTVCCGKRNFQAVNRYRFVARARANFLPRRRSKRYNSPSHVYLYIYSGREYNKKKLSFTIGSEKTFSIHFCIFRRRDNCG